MTLRYLQVANVSTACQKEQLRALFAHFGRIDELYLFPESETLSSSVGAKVGYIKFEKNDCAYTALQMSNTVFLDRSLICSLVKNSKVPVENDSLKYCASLSPNIVLLAGGATWPNTVIHRVIGIGNNSYIETIDPELSEHSLPLYPQLPGTLDPIKAEEIRRTVYVSNISKCVTLQNLNDLFSQAGEIRFIRFAGDENADCKCAYVEFSEQPHIVKALCLNGTSFASRTIKVNHATAAIEKVESSQHIFAEKARSPRHRSSSRSKRSKSPRKRSSRSKSPRKRSRSKSPRKRSRSKSLRKRSSRSKSPRKRSRSKSPRKRQSRSKSPRKRQSRSNSPRKRTTKSKSPKKRVSRSKSPNRSKSNKRSRSRKKSKSPRKRSRSPKKSSRDKDGEKRRHSSSKSKKRKRSHSKESRKRRS